MVGIEHVAGPFAVAMPTLIKHQHMVTLRQMQADQVPGMCRLMSAVQQHDWRCAWLSPLQAVKPQLPQHDVARHVLDAALMRNAEVSSTCQQRTKLFRLGHIERFSRVGKSVQIHESSRVAAATVVQARSDGNICQVSTAALESTAAQSLGPPSSMRYRMGL